MLRRRADLAERHSGSRKRIAPRIRETLVEGVSVAANRSRRFMTSQPGKSRLAQDTTTRFFVTHVRRSWRGGGESQSKWATRDELAANMGAFSRGRGRPRSRIGALDRCDEHLFPHKR